MLSQHHGFYYYSRQQLVNVAGEAAILTRHDTGRTETRIGSQAWSGRL